MINRETILRIFFPLYCSDCRKIIPVNKKSCNCKGEEIKRVEGETCFHCANEIDLCTCDSEFSAPLSFVTAVYHYSGTVRSEILLFKFQRQKYLYKELSLAMAEKVAVDYSDVSFDFVTFVPSSKATKKERGYNQSELLALGVAERLFIPKEELLVKTKDTEYQHNLKAKERAENLKKSIALKENVNIKGKTILICDDIKTTGNTLFECEKALLSGGAKAVYSAVIAVAEYNPLMF